MSKNAENIWLPEPITIQYALSPKGQEAALLAGVNASVEQTVSGQITLATLHKLGLSLNNAGTGANSATLRLGKADKTITNTGWFNPRVALDAPETFPQILARLLDLLAAQRAASEAKRAEVDAAIQAAIGDCNAMKISVDVAFGTPELVQQWYTIRNEREKTINARVQAEREAKRAAEEAAEKELAARKAAQVAEWVREHGDANQKARFAAGLFPASEAEKAIEEFAFASFTGELYKKITHDDVSKHCEDDCYTCEPKYQVFDATSVDAAEWDAMESYRNTPIPTGVELVSVTLRRHYGECANCDGETSREGIYVKLRAGSFTFVREYAIPAQ